MVRVSISILNWNGISHTLKCLQSLRKQTFKDFEIILIDNGSDKDDSVNVLKKLKERRRGGGRIKIVFNKKNLGYAGGHNIGMKHSRSKDFVVFLNNDAVLDKNWLKELVKMMDENPKLGLGSFRVLKAKGRKKPKNDGLLFINFLGYYSLLRDINLSRDWKTYDAVFTGGPSIILRKGIIEQPFIDSYFIYNDDIYLSWLIALKGWKAAHCKNSLVYSDNSTVLKENKELKNPFVFHSEKNRVTNFLLFLESKNMAKLSPVFIFCTGMSLIFKPSRTIPSLKAYAYIISKFRKIMETRKKIQSQRAVPDSIILKKVSGQAGHIESNNRAVNFLIKILNKFSLLYLKTLKTPHLEQNIQKHHLKEN